MALAIQRLRCPKFITIRYRVLARVPVERGINGGSPELGEDSVPVAMQFFVHGLESRDDF
jgi:hypothetical protein